MAIKMFTLPIKKTSILGRKKYGETMCNKPINGSVLGSRKYSEEKVNRVVLRNDKTIKESTKNN